MFSGQFSITGISSARWGQIFTAWRQYQAQSYRNEHFLFHNLILPLNKDTENNNICFWNHDIQFFYIWRLWRAYYRFQLLKLEYSDTNTRLWWLTLGRTQRRSLKAQGQGCRVLGCLVHDDKPASTGRLKTHIKTQRALQQHKRVYFKTVPV